MRGGLGDVGRHGVIRGGLRVVGLDAHEADFAGVLGVVAPQPPQHVGHLAGLVLVAHEAHEIAEVALAGADVPVDQQARRPVLLPGDGAEAHPLDEEAKRPVLEPRSPRGPVDGLAQPDDEGVVDGAPEGSQVIERGCRLESVERGGVVPDPAGHGRVPRLGARHVAQWPAAP